MSYLETLHLVTREDFKLAPTGTVVRSTRGVVGAKHPRGVWYETGCSDPADDGWFHDMVGAQVIAWGSSTDQTDPWWGQITCPNCGGSGWTVNKDSQWPQPRECGKCETRGYFTIGARVHRPTGSPVPLDEHPMTASRSWEAQVEALANHFDPEQRWLSEERPAS